MSDSPARIGIVTVSDRASRGEYEDRGGPAIREYLEEVLTSPWEPVARVVPDEVEEVVIIPDPNPTQELPLPERKHR